MTKKAIPPAREYKRDKRSPIPKSPAVSCVMSANKGKNSKPELALRRTLWGLGIRGYRLHYKQLPGKPDIVFVSKRVAVFVHGCFWHRCPTCQYPNPKTNEDYWRKKFLRNVERDQLHLKQVAKLGWKAMVIWECELRTHPTRVVNRLVRKLESI